jgi:myo-inositol-1(or 4)-monophosphatase
MNTPKDPGFDTLLSFAHTLADRSAAAILPYFRSTRSIEDKSQIGGFDPVTAADKAAEEVIRESVAQSWPAHAVLGEEFGLQPGSVADNADYCWIIDPIDGTRSFISGMPVWGTLIGLTRQDEPILGIMNQPFTGERFWNGSEGAFYSGPDGEHAIATRSCKSLAEATLLSTGPEFFSDAGDLAKFEDLSTQVRMRRYGGDCYCYCMLAAGHADLVVEAGLHSYDIAALIPIVERAGGRVTTWDGEPATRGGRVLASGDPELHEAAMAVLAA